MTKSVLGAAVLFAALAGALPVAAADGASGAGTDVKMKVYEKPLIDMYVTANFGVNRDLGRAWIEVAVAPYTDVPQSDVIARQDIKGLYYDPERKAVIYKKGASKTICAEDSKLLGETALKTTGNCELQVSSTTRNIDDGFTVRQDPVTTVTFVAHGARASRTASDGR